jgi:hypothetical protein
MKVTLKIPAVVEFPQDGENGKYELEGFLFDFRKLTGVKLKAKCIDQGYGSSYAPWILYLEKDRAYMKLLEKAANNGGVNL